MADEALARQNATDKWLMNFAAKHYNGDQRAALQDPRAIEVMRRAHPLGMMRANMYDAAQAADTGNDTLRLLLAHNEAKPLQRADASLTHHGIGYHADKTGLPENGVYVEGLSSIVPGGGTQMLKELEAQYPGLPMYLQSLDKASSQFYVKKGFVPQADKTSKEIPRDLFVKPADVKLKAVAGIPAGASLLEDQSVMDKDNTPSKIPEYIKEFLESLKDPGTLLSGALVSGNAYAEGGSVLSKLFSEGNIAKRRVKDALSDPRGVLQMIADQQRRQWKEDPQEQAMNLFNPEGAMVAGVVKNKGGNWIGGSIEDALRGLKRPVYGGGSTDPVDIASRMPAESMNSWIDKQLSRYVKNDMATPEDPIRALAERGKLHIDPQVYNVMRRDASAKAIRRGEGFPEGGMGQSQLGRDWETLSDSMVQGRQAPNPYKPGEMMKEHWLDSSGDRLGFSHLIDELSNSINTGSGLPQHLQFPADRLGKVSVPQAVERVSDINAWRAAQKAEADAMKANNAATVLHKEYPDDPKGLRWVQLKTADKNSGIGEDEYVKSIDALRDALKYEGDTMGHCVGGYCPDVTEGRSQIFSLRDAKGQPHVTVEVKPNQNRNWGAEQHQWSLDNPEEYAALKEKFPKLTDQDREYRRMFADDGVPPSIIQIKGKANKKPNDEYLQYVQDFVKSGKWSDVGDLENTGLMRREAAWDHLRGKDRLRADRFADEAPMEGFWSPGDLDNFAQGGPVKKPPPITPGTETSTIGTRGHSDDMSNYLERLITG
jgi:hypothetical protein